MNEFCPLEKLKPKFDTDHRLQEYYSTAKVKETGFMGVRVLGKTHQKTWHTLNAYRDADGAVCTESIKKVKYTLVLSALETT